MSTTIDQRVVEMRFDNQHFEKNVRTSMSTLDKLKQSLKLTDAAKGLENVGAAAKKVDMSGLSSGIQTVQTKFSALQIAGMTAMSRITNAAITAGKNIAKSLTITPITTGFNEYELKMGSIQTIMASTGKSLETVNKYLNELNEYSDKTIYSFSDMTQNIGKFTNAGVELEDAVMAIKGISNEAALSGANANEASRAMYNFAQALSAGYVKLIDWKSIENANMATKGFKEELINTAVEMGTLTKTTDGFKTSEGKVITATKNFNDSLQDQWMTSDVLITTLKKYADETTEIGKKATQAATEVKTFSQMMDALKESAQSGWAQTWEIIFGDFNEGKKLWTNINNVVGGLLNRTSDARNSFLKFNLGSSWENIAKQIENAGIKMEDFQDALKNTAKTHGKDLDKMIKEEKTLDNVMKKGLITKEEVVKTLVKYSENAKKNTKTTEDMTEKLKYFQKVVDQVWNGDYKNGAERIEALTKANYKYSEVQELVNKTVDGHRLTLEDLSVEQMKAVGYTEEQIEAIAKLADEADRTGSSLDQLLDRMTKPSGRELLIESLENIWKYINEYITLIGEAWNNIFNNENDPDKDFSLYDIIEQFHEFTETLKVSEESANNFKRVMEGLLAGFELGGSIASKSVLASIKILNAVLGLFGTDILGVAAKIADYIVVFNEWVETNTMFGWDTAYSDIAAVLKAIYDGVSKCIKAFLGLDKVKTAIESFKGALKELFNIDGIGGIVDFFKPEEIVANITAAFDKLEAWIKNSNSAENLGKYIIDGIWTGLKNGVMKLVDMIVSIGTAIINAFAGTIDSHSPSKVFIEMGTNIIDGLFLGIKNGILKIVEVVKDLGSKAIDAFKQIDFGSLFIIGGVVGLGVLANNFIKVLDKFATPIEKLGKVVGSVTGVFDQLKETIKDLGKAQALKLKSEAFLNLAKALALLAGVLIAFTFIDTNKLWQAVAILGALSLILVALSWAMDQISKASVDIDGKKVQLTGLKTGLLVLAGSLLLLALVVKTIGGMNVEQAKQGFLGLAGLVVALVSVFAAYGLLVKGKSAQNINKAGGMIANLSISLLLMVGAAKLIAGMEWTEMGKAAVGIGYFVGIVALLATIGMIPGKNISKLGGMMLSISTSLLLMVGVAKLIAGMEWADMGKAAVGILGLVGIIAILMTITMIPGENLDTIGKTIASIGAAMLLLSLTAKIIAGMEWAEMGKAAVGLLGLSAIVGILVFIVQLAEKDAPKIAGTLLAISVAVGILAGVAVILSMVNTDGLKNGIRAIGMLSVFMALMIAATKGASDCKGNLIVMTVAIGVMVAAVAALSLIDPTKMAGATLAMSLLMGVFGLMAKLSSNVTSSIGALAAMVVAVGLLAVIIYALAGLPVESVLGSAGALSMLLLSLSVSFAIISGTSATAMAALPALGMMIGAIALLAIILGALTALDCAPSLETALALSTLLLAMSAACLILSAVGAVAPAALAGAAALDGVILIIAGLLVAIGALMTYVPEVEEFLDKGLAVLEKLSTGLGKVLGGFVAGFAEGVMSALPGIATSLSDFMTNLKPFLDGMSNVKSDFSTGMENFNAGIKSVSITSLMKLGSVGDGIASYSKTVSNLDNDAIAASAKTIERMADVISGLASLDTKGASAFKDAIKNLKKTSLSELTKNFTNSSKDFENKGKELVEAMAKGVTNKSKLLCTVLINAVKLAVVEVRKQVVNFTSAGRYLVEGFANGISANTYKARARAAAMASAAANAARRELDEHSPSRVGYEIGDFFGVAFVNALGDYVSKAYTAGTNIAKSAKTGLSNAIGKISDVISSDVDSQPVIRPVLDLSDVRAGANSIGSMFGSSSVGVLATANGINSMMNASRQNGVNSDIVSAINKLDKHLGNVGNTSYNINGITYDDGSNISDAVKTLIRATKMERRV